MEKWLTSKEYRKKFNVSSAALWNRVNINKTVEMKIINGKKYYKANDIEIENNRKNVIYCRVSSDKFIDELMKHINDFDKIKDTFEAKEVPHKPRPFVFR